MTREEFIEAHSNLFWYTPEAKKKDISDALLVGTILNDGTLKDFSSLCDVLGKQHVAKVFFSATERQKKNYYPENIQLLLFDSFQIHARRICQINN